MHTNKSVCGMALVALLTATGVQAHDFCVGTAAELNTALAQASDGGPYSGDFNRIHVRQGSYTTTSGAGFHYTSTAAGGSFTVDGGYGAGCTQQVRNAALTVLDGGSATPVLTIHSAHGEIDVHWLTFSNGRSSGRGAGLSINDAAGDGGTVVVSDTIVRNNHAVSNFAGGVQVNTNGAGSVLFFENNLVVGNDADFGYGAGEIVANGDTAGVYYNTVVQNTSGNDSFAGGIYFGGTTTGGFVTNNIFWSNEQAGLHLGTSLARLYYNDIGTLEGTPQTQDGNVAVAPQFVDFAGGDFRLSGASSLIGISTHAIAATDLDGRDYGKAGLVDLGAYAETIFSTTFEEP